MTRHLLRTFVNDPIPPDVSYGVGSFLHLADGTALLDLTGGFTGHSIVGWNHPAVLAKMNEQLHKIPHVDYKTFSDPNREILASMIVSKAEHDLDMVFLCGGAGAEACESAVHLSYQSHYENGNPEKVWYISREQSYHGATSEAMSLGHRPNLDFFRPFHSPYRLRIPEHNIYRGRMAEESTEDYLDRSVGYFEQAIAKIGAKNIGGFVAETMMGGLVGDVPPLKDYWKRISRLCAIHNIHLILDEVWCGTGTSGKWFCIDHDEVSPDFIFIGKTLASGYAPLSAVITNRRVIDPIYRGSGRIENSATFQGHSVGVAAAIGVQELVLQPGFLERVERLGGLLRTLITSALRNSTFFNNVRGRGLRNSVEYRCDEQHKFGLLLTERMRQRHNIIINGKWHRVTLSPTLNIEESTLLNAIEKLCDEFLTLESEWNTIDRKSINLKNFF